MAGWISAFRVIPWAGVLAAAPAVAKGARELWESTRKQKSGAPAGPDLVLQSLEAQVEELRRQHIASSELITSMAEQHARLVDALAVLRMRTSALFVACAVMGVALLGIIAAVWLR